MVDINTSNAALQAQLQAGRQSSRLSARPPVNDSGANRTPSPQDVISKRVDARQNIPTPDRRAPVRQTDSGNSLSTTSEIEDATRRAEEFSVSREAPTGRFSNAPESARPQPLGQIVNILV